MSERRPKLRTNPWVAVAGAAAGIAVFAWTVRDAAIFHRAPPLPGAVPGSPGAGSASEPLSAVRGSAQPPSAAAQDETAGPAAAAENAAEPRSGPGSASDYGLRGDLRQALDRYRAAREPSAREDALLDLALSDDPGVLRLFADELGRARHAELLQLLDAAKQHGDRALVPRLRQLAESAQSTEERNALIDTADYLDLPSFTELRRGQWPAQGAGSPAAPASSTAQDETEAADR